MAAPFTVVTLIDEDEDEFPMRLPGVYRSYCGADIEAALLLLVESEELHPRGDVRFGGLEYFD